MFAADGERHSSRGRDTPDLILMDLSLPRMDGWEATRRLKADPAIARDSGDRPVGARDEGRRGPRAGQRLRRLLDQADRRSAAVPDSGEASWQLPQATVLIVDDEPLTSTCSSRSSTPRAIGRSPRKRRRCTGAAAKSQPDLILLDVMMAGIDGYETCRRLKAGETTRIDSGHFLTALTDTFDKVRAFRLGAVDYVTKPFETEELLARVGTHIALRREIEAHRRSKATIHLLVDEIRPDRDSMSAIRPRCGACSSDRAGRVRPTARC